MLPFAMPLEVSNATVCPIGLPFIFAQPCAFALRISAWATGIGIFGNTISCVSADMLRTLSWIIWCWDDGESMISSLPLAQSCLGSFLYRLAAVAVTIVVAMFVLVLMIMVVFLGRIL